MKLLPRAAALAVISWAYLGGRGGRADAAGVLCETVEPDTISVDGMLDDWEAGGRTAGAGSDASFSLRCVHDAERLYLAIDVVDERILRAGRQPDPRSDDHLELLLRAGDGRPEGALLAYPGVGKIPPARSWRGGRLPAAFQVEDSLQKRGWALEAAIPLRELAGWGPHTPAVYYRLAYHDADLASAGKVETVVGLDGRLVTAAGAAAYKAFLAEQNLRVADLKLDKLVDVDGEPGVERVLVGGKVIGIITDQYSYLVLPVDRPADVLAVALVEPTSSGRPVFLAHLRQRGNGGIRELVAVWTLNGDGSFLRTVAVEVGKQLGERSLKSRWKLVPRPAQKAHGAGKRRTPAVPAGTDLVVEAGEAQGWDEDSYEETPAEDVTPILTPWGDEQRAVFGL